MTSAYDEAERHQFTEIYDCYVRPYRNSWGPWRHDIEPIGKDTIEFYSLYGLDTEQLRKHMQGWPKRGVDVDEQEKERKTEKASGGCR